MKKILLYIALFTAIIADSYAQNVVFSKTGNSKRGPYGTKNYAFDSTIYKGGLHVSPSDYFKMPYRLMSPEITDSTKKYPLFVMLHGASEGMGTTCSKDLGNNVCQLVWGSKNLVDSSAKYPTYALFPQSYGGYWGNAVGADYEFSGEPEAPMRGVIEIIENLIKTTNVDPDRIYLAGLSNGAKGAWELLERRPDLFASTSTFSGMGNPKLASTLINNPVWNFQGGKDNNPNPFETERMYEALAAAGGTPKRSLYEDRDHWVWLDAYHSKNWMNWVFNQDKKNIHILYGKPAEITDAAGLAIGISYGYKNYQWKLNGENIPGAQDYVYNATEKGIYTVSFTRFDGSTGLSNPLNLGSDIIITNIPPAANAGMDIKDTLPTESIVLRGEGTDSDGNIISYTWSQVSGADLTLSGISSSTLTLTNLNAGNYKFELAVNDDAGAVGRDTVEVIIVNKPTTSVKVPVVITFNDLSFVYDGESKNATASVHDSIPVTGVIKYTYNGAETAPINAGSYLVEASLIDSNYQGMAYGMLTISKKEASVTFVETSGTYIGTPLQASAITEPAGLEVLVLYNGDTVLPENAGSYSIEAIIQDDNFQGRNVGRFVISKAPAKVTVEAATFVYDGTAKSSIVVTEPAGLAVSVLYNDLVSAPVQPGVYDVIANVQDMNYFGSAESELTITSILSVFDNNIEGLKVFPNPTSDILNIEFEKSSIQRIRLINMSGITVMESKTEYKTAESLNIQNLPRGAYNVIIDSKDGKENIYKIIVN